MLSIYGYLNDDSWLSIKWMIEVLFSHHRRRGHQPLVTSWQTHIHTRVKTWKRKKRHFSQGETDSFRRLILAQSHQVFHVFFHSRGVALEKRFMEARTSSIILSSRASNGGKLSAQTKRRGRGGKPPPLFSPHSFRFSKVISHQSFSCFSPFCTFSRSNWQRKSP